MTQMAVPSKVEVLIVGAGPAGAILAYELARLGKNVLLLEKTKFPRRKTCGGGLNLRTVRLLPFDLAPVTEREIRGISFSRNLDQSFLRRSPEPFMITTTRDKLDQFLVSQAENAGARFLDETQFLSLSPQNDSLEVETSAGIFRTNFIVGADGANGAVAKKGGVPLETSHMLALHSEVPFSLLPEQELDVIQIDWGSLKRGYAYLFPKATHFSMGAGGYDLSSHRIKKYQRAFWAANWRREGSPPFSTAGFFLPLRRRRSPIYNGRCLLVGDAAGLIDPFSGEGIYSAVRSAQIAAPFLAEFLKDGFDSLTPYQDEIDRTLMPELECSRLFRELFARWPSFFHRRLQTRDRWWNAMVRILRGEKSNLDLKKRLGILGDLLLRMAR